MHSWNPARGLRAALLCVALAGVAAAAEGAAPNVIYTASGTFGQALSGADSLKLAGQAFSISVTANEALKPTRHTDTSAEYTGLAMSGTCGSGLTPTMVPLSTKMVNIDLRVGGQGTPDGFKIGYPVQVLGATITVAAEVEMPAGTITTRAIQPFTAPVTFDLINVRVNYTTGGATTTLGIASGTLSTAVER